MSLLTYHHPITGSPGQITHLYGGVLFVAAFFFSYIGSCCSDEIGDFLRYFFPDCHPRKSPGCLKALLRGWHFWKDFWKDLKIEATVLWFRSWHAWMSLEGYTFNDYFPVPQSKWPWIRSVMLMSRYFKTNLLMLFTARFILRTGGCVFSRRWDKK